MSQTGFELIRISLEIAVPLHIETVRVLPWPERMAEVRVAAQILDENAEYLIVKKEGKTAAAFNATARAIAVLSFLPGGVTIFGRHWESTDDSSGATAPGSPASSAPGSSKPSRRDG